MLPPIILFLLILSFLVFIHELGHFLSARKFGVKVDEFGIGIPPRAWGKKIGETIYSLNWLPIGGFVRIRGEDFDDYDPKDPENFINKKPWQKSVILLAGVFMNFILAVAIFYFVLGMNGWRSGPLVVLTDYNFPFGDRIEINNVVMGFAEDSPAEKAGVGFGDRVIMLEQGEDTAEPANADELRAFLSDKGGTEINVLLENINSGEQKSVTVSPTFNEAAGQVALGVQLGEVMQLDYTKPSQKLFAGFTHSVNVLGYSVEIMKTLFSASVQSRDVRPVAEGVSGPVGIYGAVASITEFGGDKVLLAILDLTALLSLSLAIMNLLPFPALDGGRWVFVLSEWVTGKKPSQKLEARAHQIGFAVLLAFIILVTFKDIFQFIL